MKRFIFNDVSSDSLGIVVKSMPKVPRPAKDIESIKVSGRNGNLHIDNGNYESINYTIECICTDKTKIDEINKVLQGSGKLILSDYDNRFWNAIIKNQIAYKEYLTYLNSFPLIFELDPISKGISEITEIINETKMFEVLGNTDVYPKLTITGIGEITLNGKSLQVTESEITIDCELMQCYNSTIAKNDKVILDEFPTLRIGTNDISLGQGITQVKIEYREGWI